MKLLFEPQKTVFYEKDRWRLLGAMRAKGVELLEILSKINVRGLLYGSVARGDVNKGSDVDLVILKPRIPTSLVEYHLRRTVGEPMRKEIVQSTPVGAIKAYLYLEANVAVSFPLSPLRQREEEFYKFGGTINLREAKLGLRVPGVNKKLILIHPFEKGHHEASIRGMEAVVSDILGISKEAIDERVRVLSKRREKGTTGVYLKYELMPEESFEEALKGLIGVKKGVKRRLADLI